MAENEKVLRARLDEVNGVLEGLNALRQDIRRSAGDALGKAGNDVFTALSAQALMLDQLQAAMRQRAQAIERSIAEPQEPANGRRARGNSRAVGLEVVEPTP